MERTVIKCLNTIVFAILFIFICMLLMPSLIKELHNVWGKWLYGGMVVVVVSLAVRLRFLVRKLGA